MGVDKEKSEEQVLRSEGGDDVERGGGWVEGDDREGKIAKSAPAMLVCTRGVWDKYKKKCPYEGFIINLKPPLSNLKKLKTQEQKKTDHNLPVKTTAPCRDCHCKNAEAPCRVCNCRGTPRGVCATKVVDLNSGP